jgi:hypothetical protein
MLFAFIACIILFLICLSGFVITIYCAATSPGYNFEVAVAIIGVPCFFGMLMTGWAIVVFILRLIGG